MKTIKKKHLPGIWLQLTTEMDRGQTVVEMRPDGGYHDGTLLTATEARRLASALLRLADLADRRDRKAQP